MAARGVVALIEPMEEMNAANSGSAEFVQAWVDSTSSCAEDTEEERTQRYAALHGAGYKPESKRRLRGMIDE